MHRNRNRNRSRRCDHCRKSTYGFYLVPVPTIFDSIFARHIVFLCCTMVRRLIISAYAMRNLEISGEIHAREIGVIVSLTRNSEMQKFARMFAEFNTALCSKNRQACEVTSKSLLIMFAKSINRNVLN